MALLNVVFTQNRRCMMIPKAKKPTIDMPGDIPDIFENINAPIIVKKQSETATSNTLYLRKPSRGLPSASLYLQRPISDICNRLIIQRRKN